MEMACLWSHFRPPVGIKDKNHLFLSSSLVRNVFTDVCVCVCEEGVPTPRFLASGYVQDSSFGAS